MSLHRHTLDWTPSLSFKTSPITIPIREVIRSTIDNQIHQHLKTKPQSKQQHLIS